MARVSLERQAATVTGSGAGLDRVHALDFARNRAAVASNDFVE